MPFSCCGPVVVSIFLSVHLVHGVLLSPSSHSEGPSVLFRKMGTSMRVAGEAHLAFELPVLSMSRTAMKALEKVSRTDIVLRELGETPGLINLQVRSHNAGAQLEHQLVHAGIRFKPGPFGKSQLSLLDDKMFDSVHSAGPMSTSQIDTFDPDSNSTFAVKCDSGWNARQDHARKFVDVDHLRNFTGPNGKQQHAYFSDGKAALGGSADFVEDFSYWTVGLVRGRIMNNVISHENLNACFEKLQKKLRKEDSGASIVQSTQDLSGRDFSYRVNAGVVTVVIHLTYVQQTAVFEVFQTFSAPLVTQEGIFGLHVPGGLLAISTLPDKAFYQLDAREFGSCESYRGHQVCEGGGVTYVSHGGTLYPSDLRCVFSIYNHYNQDAKMTCRVESMTEEDIVKRVVDNTYSVSATVDGLRTACGTGRYYHYDSSSGHRHRVKPGCSIKAPGLHVTGKNFTGGDYDGIEWRPFPKAWVEFLEKGEAAARAVKLYSPVDLPSIEGELRDLEYHVTHDIIMVMMVLFIICICAGTAILLPTAVYRAWKWYKAFKRPGVKTAHNGDIELA